MKELPDVSDENRPLICGFLKVRNEIVREGDLARVLNNLRQFCDVIVACDDASIDGTRAVLQREIPAEHLLLIDPAEQDFRNELAVKDRMMQIVHRLRPHFIWWADGDEELSPEGVTAIRAFCHERLGDPAAPRDPTLPKLAPAYRCHYTQLWRNATWARTDYGFDDGWFVKLWRWSPDLCFDVVYRTHHAQFPRQFLGHDGELEVFPYEVIHWGNYGKNLIWKVVTYRNGLGDSNRHLHFESASFRQVQRTSEGMPRPYTPREVELIDRVLGDMKARQQTFMVVIPTHNRGWALDETLASLERQVYPYWIAVVLDDGSTDDTCSIMRRWQDRDPRVFYARYPKLGAVALNEIGMDLACEWTEYWTRLGSDDWFEPNKLLLDARALRDHALCYGPYQVFRDGQKAELCNAPMPAEEAIRTLGRGGFVLSWANIAARTSALREVKRRWGSHVDPRLVNMEDFLSNYRLTRVARPVWRGVHGDELYVDPTAEQIQYIRFHANDMKPEAYWRVSADGASSNNSQTSSDDQVTRDLIARDEAAAMVATHGHVGACTPAGA